MVKAGAANFLMNFTAKTAPERVVTYVGIRVCAVYARCKKGSVRQLSLEIELVTIAKESHYISKLGSNL